MTVVFLCDYYHPFEIGGAERSSERLASELVGRGVTVVVVTPNYGAPPQERFAGVEVIRLPFPQRLVPGAVARRIWTANPLLHEYYGLRIAALIRRYGAAVVHVQNSTLITAGWIAARLAGARLVVTVRDLAYVEPQSRDPAGSFKARIDSYWASIERRIKRSVIKRADAVIFVSEALRSAYASMQQSEIGSRAHVIYNIAPEPLRVELAREPGTVLYVGKLSTGKGLHVLLDAARLVRPRISRIRFILVGRPGTGFVEFPTDLLPYFERRGRLAASDVERLMASCALLVVPSVWPEPLSRVILEGMSRGIPIVATDAGGNTEAISHGVSGWIVPAGDAVALAEGIERLLTDQPLASRLAETARVRSLQLFGPDRIIPSLLRVYEEACARA